MRKESQNINNALDEWSGLSLPYPHYHMINSIPKGQLRGVYCLNTRLYNGIVHGINIIFTSIPSDGHPIGKATLVLLLNMICSNKFASQKISPPPLRSKQNGINPALKKNTKKHCNSKYAHASRPYTETGQWPTRNCTCIDNYAE